MSNLYRSRWNFVREMVGVGASLKADERYVRRRRLAVRSVVSRMPPERSVVSEIASLPVSSMFLRSALVGAVVLSLLILTEQLGFGGATWSAVGLSIMFWHPVGSGVWWFYSLCHRGNPENFVKKLSSPAGDRDLFLITIASVPISSVIAALLEFA